MNKTTFEFDMNPFAGWLHYSLKAFFSKLTYLLQNPVQ